MQGNFIFFLFLSSSRFFLEVMVKFFDYFWKPNNVFFKFRLTVFWCSTSYTVIFVPWKMLMEPNITPDCWWPCGCLKCVSGLRRLEKTLNFLRFIHVFDLVLKNGSDIKEGNLWQLLFYFIVLVGIVASVIGMSFFQLCFRFYIEVFSYCTLTETFAIDSKSDSTTNGLILGFLFGNGFFRWLLICMDWKLQELLNC